MKNNKRTGINNLHAEFINYSLEELDKRISQIINNTSESSDYPKVLRQGILTALPKSPKKSEQVNVQPAIILSVPQKVITIIPIDCAWKKVKVHIPPRKHHI